MWLKRSIFSGPVRYFAVVAVGYGVDFLVYSTIVSCGLSIYLAALTGFLVGTAVNVSLVRRFVFDESRHPILQDYFLTLLANGAVFVFGTFILGALVDYAGVNPYWAKLLVNLLTFGINYLTRVAFFNG